MTIPFPGTTLDRDDLLRIAGQTKRLEVFMLSHGEYRRLGEIAWMIGASEAGASARLRDLRKEPFNYLVEKRRCGRGLWEYKVSRPEGQGRLF